MESDTDKIVDVSVKSRVRKVPLAFDGLARLTLGLLLAAAAPGVCAAVHYVDTAATRPTPPYGSWDVAATNIQDAIDVARPGDQIVVTNGIYATGGRLAEDGTNRVVIDKSVNVWSVNGPAVTVIEGAPSAESTFFGLGDGAIRCAYVGYGALLSGFTLTNGHTRIGGNGGGALCAPSAILTDCVVINNRSGDPDNDSEGGGVYRGTLYRCRLLGNVSHGEGGGAAFSTLYDCVIAGNNSGDGGGGVSAGTLYNCLLSSNRSEFVGGGAFGATLNNCTVVGNSANRAGGVYSGALTNCIVYYNNTDTVGANYLDDSADLTFTCTFPLPARGTGNITNEPAFVDFASGNYHLRQDSPCIDVGLFLTPILTADLNGNPRPLDGNGDGLPYFDLGAYEHRFEIIERPAIRSVALARNRLVLSWEGAPGLRLQGAAAIANAPWTDVPGSEGQSSFEFLLTDEDGFFRLVAP